MSDTPALPTDPQSQLPWLATITGLAHAEAIALLQQNQLITIETVQTLAEVAREQVEIDPDVAETWLDLAAVLQAQLATTEGKSVAAVNGQMAYARARLLVHRGQLTAAEDRLRQAQIYWQEAGDSAGFARTLLGLTQILAMQGRYGEAEESARTAVAVLTDRMAEFHRATTNISDMAAAPPPVAANFDLIIQVAGAHHNLATLLLYTERHSAALAEYNTALQQLEALDQRPLTAEERHTWQLERAHNALNRAGALTFLDQPGEAEVALRRAGDYFLQVGHNADHGRVQTNLGRLYLRTGQYVAALHAFDRASIDLLGDPGTTVMARPRTESTNPEQEPVHSAQPDLEAMRAADELLLEQAMAYLVMNLLPEAEQALARCEALFRAAQQPYELGQTLYTLGLVRLRARELGRAAALLAEAITHFEALDNPFWLNRTALAQAALAHAQGEQQRAALLLDALLATRSAASSPTVATTQDDEPILRWDIGGLVELLLLRLRVAIELGQLSAATQWGAEVASLIGLTLPASEPATDPVTDPAEVADEVLPHYALRLYHLLGRLARAQGLQEEARRSFLHAIALLERTRALLPVEEIRTAFLDDKAELYADLILLLLDQADADPQAVADAFAAVERARSRALLDRLLTAIREAEIRKVARTNDNESSATSGSMSDSADVDDAAIDAVTTETEALRQRLHWLYNQLLGESGSRRLDTRLSAQLLAEEAALKQIEWRQSALLQQAQPTDLASFQAALGQGQQALVYTILQTPSGSTPESTPGATSANGEVMAFLVDQHTITPYRHLTTTIRLESALAELRFQLGRAELGPAYLARHHERLQIRLQQVLAQLYQQLMAPLRSAINNNRLLIVPFGPLHRLPFHALWDGQHYLVEQITCSYAPSASVVVTRQQGKPSTAAASLAPFRSWAGLAVDDVAIPGAREEVMVAARTFTDARLYLDQEANRQGLAQAAEADIVHLATHGLFRPDNPFFSALKLADGWINVQELYHLPLRARLVVLSACESGAGIVRGGDEVVGLARGFLGAGALEVLASLWNVHDESAVAFMQHFYEFLTEEPIRRPAEALRSAQCAAIARCLHPYYWAPFYVIGE